ncbi:MAG: DNA primase [Hyphomicrobiales bacterium]|nr:DNA primase [Hyphomicrobiales bacterium]MBV9426439.1 DNA primase [Bradyrhizobiaceae bacterium]
MAFPPQFLDELRARLPVSEVVGRRVKLRKAGREWKALSPFNQEKTPSFTVNDQKGFFHDFSSGKHGDIFDFVMETEGLTFPEAVERLAGMAGLPVPKVSKEAQAREERRKTLHDVIELAAKFFEATLAARAGARARGYLADRAIAPQTQLRFRVGYAPPERYALKEHLGAHGVPVPDMVEAGLLIAGEDVSLPFDRFRDRVIFPISDFRGRVIGFGGRALSADVPAKYLNSPETPLFHKGLNLYNGAAARIAAHQGAQLIAVEGYVDVIAMVTAGFEATVAPLGTALTEEQLALLWRMADEPVLCFDGDKAGRRAAYRAVDLALPQLRPGKSLRFAVLPEGQDPDDLVRAGGREAVDEVLAGARPLVEMLWLRETEDGSFDTPERRAALETRIAAVAGAIGEESVRRYYRQHLADRLKRLFAAPEPTSASRGRDFPERRAAWGRRGARKPLPREALVRGQPYVVMSPNLATSPVHRGYRSSMPPREALILQAVLNHPWLLHEHMEELAQIEFRHGEAQKAKTVLIDAFAHGAAGDRAQLQAELAARGYENLRERIERAITTASVWGVQPDAGPDDVLLTWKQLLALHRQGHSLRKELKEAEIAFGLEDSKANLDWLNDVRARLSAIDGIEALVEGFGASSGRAARTL